MKRIVRAHISQNDDKSLCYSEKQQVYRELLEKETTCKLLPFKVENLAVWEVYQ